MGYILAWRSDKSFLCEAVVKSQRLAGFSEEASQVTHIEVSGGGVHAINISPPISKLVDITKAHAGRYVYVLRYRNSDYEIKGRYKIAYYSATLCNRFYDIPGILGFLFKWIKQGNRLWFCSEGALWSLQKEYPGILDAMRPDKCMPAHFISSEEFEVVWAGLIPDNIMTRVIRKLLTPILYRKEA